MHLPQYIEQTVFVLFIWVGGWGVLHLFIEHVAKDWLAQLVIYVALLAIGFAMMNYRKYI